MSFAVAIVLGALVIVLLLIERRHGPRMTRELKMKGDIKRESAFLAQYGQSVATPIAAWLAAIAFGNDWRVFAIVCLPVLATSASCAILKRCLGRIRPNREAAGRFTGPSWRHDNRRESFPSSHSACAFALTIVLVHLWPAAAGVFWMLAFVTAALRYLMNAHFPSDIVAGSLLGVALAAGTFDALVPVLFADGRCPQAVARPR